MALFLAVWDRPTNLTPPEGARGDLQVGLPDARPDRGASAVLAVPLLLYIRKTDMAILKSKALPDDLVEYWQN